MPNGKKLNMERYRSGHNGADSKSVCAKAHEGSNPSLSAKGGYVRIVGLDIIQPH